MQETEMHALLRRKATPVAQGFLQQRESADNVGLDEIAWAVDGAVNMAFSGEIHHRIRLVFLEQLTQRRAFADALLFESVMRIADGAGEGLQVGGIGQLVDV